MPRFNRRGQEKVYAVPSGSNARSVAVLTGATSFALHRVLRAIAGFNYTGEDLDAADMSTTWGKTIPGGSTAGDSSFTFYEGDLDADFEEVVLQALDKGTTWQIVFAKRGVPVVGAPLRVWTVRIKSNNPDETADNAAATFTIGMSIPDEPDLYAVAVA